MATSKQLKSEDIWIDTCHFSALTISWLIGIRSEIPSWHYRFELQINITNNKFVVVCIIVNNCTAPVLMLLVIVNSWLCCHQKWIESGAIGGGEAMGGVGGGGGRWEMYLIWSQNSLRKITPMGFPEQGTCTPITDQRRETLYSESSTRNRHFLIQKWITCQVLAHYIPCPPPPPASLHLLPHHVCGSCIPLTSDHIITWPGYDQTKVSQNLTLSSSTSVWWGGDCRQVYWWWPVNNQTTTKV